MASERASQQAFVGVSALLFAASVAVTVIWSASMSTMGEMPTAMPHSHAMDHASGGWMRMPGRTRLGATASFLGMWVVMMVAMMLPSLVPMLWRYREAVRRTVAPAERATSLGWLTVVVGTAYFLVWTAFGMAVFPLGSALATIDMQHSTLAAAVPSVVGVVVLAAGVLQFTSWKTRHLACCRESPSERTLPSDVGTAWRHGLRIGLHCSYSCANLTAILLVVGVMDVLVMALVAAAITAERLAPAGERVARGIGVVVIAAGVILIWQQGGHILPLNVLLDPAPAGGRVE